tara:strand:- start:248 stop:721 length:474 start_codon:yes stop_codon:yes gene_type:complete
MNLKEVEFKLMFKTLLVIILIFLFLIFAVSIFTSLYDKFVKEPFQENNPWSKYVDENIYTKNRDYYIENGDYQLNKDYLDNMFCSLLNFPDEFKVLFDKRAEKHFLKLDKSKKFTKEKEKDFFVYAVAIPIKLKEIYSDIDDPDHQQGIIQYCYDVL